MECVDGSRPTLGSVLKDLSDFGNGACVGYDRCMKVCPVVDSSLSIAELNEAADDPTAMTEDVRKFVIDCVQCGHCTSACPTGAPRDHMMLYLREQMPDRPKRYTSYARIRGGSQPWYLEALISLFNLFSRSKTDPRMRPHIDRRRGPPSDTLLYFGCYAFSGTGSPTITMDLADAMGIEYDVLGGLRTCCGWPQYLSGDTARAEVLLDALYEDLQATRPKVVVSGCAECVAAVQVLARRSGGAFESISTVEWLQRNREKLDLTPQDLSVTFHDSCHMTRKMNRGSAPRELMDGLVENTEMEDSGKQGLCCGYYGFGINEEKTRELRLKRLAQVKATGTRTMAVECVTCMESYGHLAEEAGVEVVELQKIVLDAVKAKGDSG